MDGIGAGALAELGRLLDAPSPGIDLTVEMIRRFPPGYHVEHMDPPLARQFGGVLESPFAWEATPNRRDQHVNITGLMRGEQTRWGSHTSGEYTIQCSGWAVAGKHAEEVREEALTMMRVGGVRLARDGPSPIHVCLTGAQKDAPTGRLFFRLHQPWEGVLFRTLYRPLMAPLAGHGDVLEGTMGVPFWEPWCPYWTRAQDRRLMLDHPDLAGVTAEDLEDAVLEAARSDARAEVQPFGTVKKAQWARTATLAVATEDSRRYFMDTAVRFQLPDGAVTIQAVRAPVGGLPFDRAVEDRFKLAVSDFAWPLDGGLMVAGLQDIIEQLPAERRGPLAHSSGNVDGGYGYATQSRIRPDTGIWYVCVESRETYEALVGYRGPGGVPFEYWRPRGPRLEGSGRRPYARPPSA